MTAETFSLVSSEGGARLECRALAELPWLVHAFGTRQGGALKPEKSAKSAGNGFAGSAPGGFLRALGAGRFPLAALRQTHSSIIYSVARRSGRGPLLYQLAGNPLPGSQDAPGTRPGDALMTEQAGILLSVRVADCVPILLADREGRVVAAVHAGWRGALSRIIEKSAGEMCRTFGSRPQNLVAAVGPSIRACCYEVGPEVLDAFCGTFPAGEQFFHKVLATPEESRMALRFETLFRLQAPPGHRAEDALSKIHLDLAAVARYQLEHAGVPPGQIHVADYCTACRTDLFYSYRKEGSLAGRMMAVIGMRPLK